MGNAHVKPHPRIRNKKQVHWRAAGGLVQCFGSKKNCNLDIAILLALPQAPGKPYLASDTENTADLVTIRWSKPVNDGGSPIQGYLVEHRRQGSPHWVRASPLLVQLPELTVSGLEPGWRYQFRVRAENAVGLSDPSELSEPITVTLHRSAITAPRFTQKLNDATALENEKVEFTVNFLGQPAPKVCWFKDAFEIFSSRRIRITTDTDRSTLTIHQCSLSDEGEIKCTATNRAGHAATKAKLTVEAPPSIRLPRQYEDGLLFEIGEQIRLKVSVAGRPTPLVFWSHDGETINNSDRYEIESSNASSVLKIHEARREDRGEYQIKAVNKISSDVQSFLVTVTDKPSPPGKARVVMALGRSVTLSWVPPKDDGGCKIGNYIVEYYRVGWDVWLKAATSRQLTTMLGDLIEGSEYKFRVKAESPYGVSEPSDETETVFIPDAKRGILQPPSRGRSQPKEVIESSLNTTPVAIRRKKPRSQSSSRAEDEQKTVHFGGSAPPIRPERSKIKSPPKTPEMSPIANRKVVEKIINKQFFEQSGKSMARELAYGSPEIKVRKETYLSNSSSSDRSRTPSPAAANQASNHKRYIVKIERSPERQTGQPPKAEPTNGKESLGPELGTVQPPRNLTDEIPKKPPSPQPQKKSLTPSPKANKKLPRENSENFTGSSEFMLVLYPGLNEIGQSDFDYNDNLVPPPMSLSAPELGSEEPPQFNILRSSSSSSELLHERAMIRLYEAAEAEEKELERRRIAGEGRTMSVPKILINSKDDQDIVGLDRQNSIKRRMSAGGISHQKALWAQRRTSLKSPAELRNELLQQRSFSKISATADEKRALMMDRQRSESEEKEEQALEDVRRKMQGQSSLEKRKIEVVDEENWADDYTSSTESDSEISESEDERLLRAKMEVFKRRSYDSEEEEEPYHPGGLAVRTSSDDKPFEILTKRKEPPSPDFVPKPILKKSDKNTVTPIAVASPPTSPTRRAGSPIPTMSPPMSPTRRAGSPIPARTPPTSPTRRPMSPIRSMSPPSSPNKSSSPVKRDVSPTTNNNSNRSRSHSLAATPEDFESIRKFSTEKIPQRQRSASLALQEEYLSMKSEFPNRPPVTTVPDTSKPAHLMHTISAVAQISGITAASVVIPGQLLDKKKDEEEAKVVIDHYGDIVKNYGSKKRNNPPIYLDRDSLKKAAESSENKNFEENSETRKEEPAQPDINKFTDHYTTARRDSLTTPKPATSSHTKPFSPTRQRSPSPKRISSASPGRRKPQLAMSPVRVENWSPPSHQGEVSIKQGTPQGRQRKTSPSPMRTEKGKKTAPSPGRATESKKKASPLPMRAQGKRKTSPSPMRHAVSGVPNETRDYSGYRPLLKEIMTQTSEGLNSFDSDAYSRTSSPTYQDELMERAKVTVRGTVDYITDLAMFVVACWLYIFKNELLAIPVLLVLAYRQLQAEISKRIPNWLLRLAARFQRKK
ncbi:unnamed protein product [Callosobruchus maculatus]|uniref:Fibronectin type-III domain-containing protein n=1 Tax=Callosobruchus maculatus TaxID=64391 RepID=A0A653D3J7_CALMS|nr:unnamed protein product [Callosobruchus maculatus]